MIQKNGVTLFDGVACQFANSSSAQIFARAHEVLSVSDSHGNSWEVLFRFDSPASYRFNFDLRSLFRSVEILTFSHVDSLLFNLVKFRSMLARK